MLKDESKEIVEEFCEASAERLTARPVKELLGAMASVIARGDCEAAAKLVVIAESEHPSDSSLASALAKCKSLANRGKWLKAALDDMRRHFEDDRYADAVGHYRQALSLCRGIPALKASVDAAALKQVDPLLPHNWRIAEVMLQEASFPEAPLVVSKELRQRLEHAQKAENVTGAIHQADRLSSQGKTEEAKKELADLLAANPEDKRIQERLQRLENPAELTPKPPVLVESTPQPEAPDIVAAAAGPVPDSPSPPKSRRVFIAVKASTWNGLQNFGALAASTAMLGAAGYLVWAHFTKPPTPPKPIAVVQRPAEERAWELVKSSDDADSIRSFLIRYPASAHAIRAKVKLAAVVWEKVDKNNPDDLDDYLRRFPESPFRAEAERLKNSARQTP